MNLEDQYYFGHLQPTSLENKELFLEASRDIQHSFTGRLDMLGLHTFFIEASLLIRNAVKQYEEGLFDAAFYSVRTAVELARVVTYFGEETDPKESEIYKDWRSGGKFPFDSVIRGELEKSSAVYQEVREALPEFFNEQAIRLKQVQKYVHKQGYKTFYERGFKSTAQEITRRKFMVNDFNSFIINSLAEIALLRLCIDPFPILLRDPDVMYKIHYQSRTEAFGDKTVDQVIGRANVDLYRTTEYYKSHVAYFEDNQVLTEDTYTLINDQFYDRKKWSDIRDQLHLISGTDLLAVLIFNKSKVIAKIYAQGGFQFYFSDVKTARKKWGFNSDDLKVGDINKPYDEAFLSYVRVAEEDLWLEHNKPLPESVIQNIESINPQPAIRQNDTTTD